MACVGPLIHGQLHDAACNRLPVHRLHIDSEAHRRLRIFALVPNVYSLIPRTARDLTLVEHVKVTAHCELGVVLEDL